MCALALAAWSVSPAEAHGCLPDDGGYRVISPSYVMGFGAHELPCPTVVRDYAERPPAITGIAADPLGQGHWEVRADSNVASYASGDRQFGPGRPLHYRAPLVGIAGTATGHGYWTVAADGGVFTYGDAPFLGSAAERRLTAPIVGMAATSSGDGYWLAQGAPGERWSGILA